MGRFQMPSLTYPKGVIIIIMIIIIIIITNMQQQWTSKNNTGNWKILSCSSYVEREIHYQIEKKKEKKKELTYFLFA